MQIDKLHLKGGKGNTKWNTVAKKLRDKGFNYLPGQLKNKWQYEKLKYKNVKDNNRQTGRNRLDYKFEMEMNVALKDDETVTPKFLKTSEGRVSLSELNVDIDDMHTRQSCKPSTSASVTMEPNSGMHYAMRQRKIASKGKDASATTKWIGLNIVLLKGYKGEIIKTLFFVFQISLLVIMCSNKMN